MSRTTPRSRQPSEQVYKFDKMGVFMRVSRTGLLASTVMASVVLLAPAYASAQTQSNENNEGSEQATTVSDIVVTGSRIKRSAYNSTQPVQIITTEEASLAGMVDTAEILQGSTAAATAGQINNYFTGYVTTGGPGANTLSLRGLGAQRTLVLINGRRAGPAGVRGTVGPTDLNVIPSSLVERVEILTDGASSIYGSDAVAGVVNIITKTNRDGGHMDAFASVPFESGGEEYNVSGSYGWTSDRGYLALAADYYERKALLFGDRDIFACPQLNYFYDENNLIRADLVDSNTGEYKCSSTTAGLITFYDAAFRGTDFKPDPAAIAGGGLLGCDRAGWAQVVAFTSGVGACAVNATRSPAVRRAYAERNPSHDERYGGRTAVSPSERITLNLFTGYDLTPTTEIFGEFLYNRRNSEQKSFRQVWADLAIPASHPRNPFTGVAYLDPTILINSDAKQEVDYYRGLAGIRGKLNLGREFDWELAGQYSRSEATYGSTFIYKDRLYAAQGADGCDEEFLTTATACPVGGVDWFSVPVVRDGQFRAEDAAFLFGYEEGATTYEHAYVEGLISGDLFDLPAGPVGAAVGFQIRKESLDDRPGEQERTSNSWGLTAAGRTKGDDAIKELFAEIEIPAIRNVPLIDSLTFNVSGRYSDYDSYGENSTYKVGLNWAITPEWRIRASRGTSFRAPALYELYLANQTSFLGQTSADPCLNWGNSTNTVLQANCAAAGIPDNLSAGGSSSAEVTTGGGRGILEAETADSTSVGLIWTPSFTNLSVALDYFKIEIDNEVARFGAANIVRNCYLSENFPNDPLCSLFTRAAPGTQRQYQVLTINDSYINISRQLSEGLDLNARYSKDFSFGDLTLNARASYIMTWEQQLRTAIAPTDLNGRIGNPEWVANLSARFDRNDWTIFWSTDIVAESSNDRLYASNSANYLGETVYLNRTVDTYLNHNLSVRKRMDKWEVQVGIRNLFDDTATMTSASGGGRGAGNVPLSSQYDYLGRRGYISVSRSW